MNAHEADHDPNAADHIKSVPLVRDGGSTRPNAFGRPARLTVSKFLKICGWIQQGKTNTLACRVENISYSGFRAHIKAKPRWRKRYEYANEVRDEFVCDLHLTNIFRHAEQSWQASAWLLERRFPHRFALHFSHREVAAGTASNYAGLTKEQLLQALETAQRVSLEAPKGFDVETLTESTETGT